MCLGGKEGEGFLWYLMPLFQSAQEHDVCQMALWCYSPFLLDQLWLP